VQYCEPFIQPLIVCRQEKISLAVTTKHMKIIVSENYEALSRQIAADVAEVLINLERPLFCPTSGDTPKGLYAALLDLQKAGKINFSNCLFVGLDEWTNMNGEDEGSCRQSLDVHFFGPAGIAAEQVCFFDGKNTNGEAECKKVEDFIAANGGIDLVVLGLGLNGHVGMNEPGTPADIRSHVSILDPQTAQTGQKYFTRPTALATGLTLGIATLLSAKHIFLMVNGSRKAAIVKHVVDTDATESIPATLLKGHPGFHIYLDKAAAAFIE